MLLSRSGGVAAFAVLQQLHKVHACMYLDERPGCQIAAFSLAAQVLLDVVTKRGFYKPMTFTLFTLFSTFLLSRSEPWSGALHRLF
jgi:hypothetical protein